MEIERKYLIKELNFDLNECRHIKIEQSYISFKPVIRLRKADDEFYLTVKGSGSIVREEFELAISYEEYQDLRKKASGKLIKKTRYLVPLSDGHTAELDVFEGEHDGLITVEVEFSRVSDMKSFNPPDWFGIDVSENSKYKNSNLAKSFS